MSEGTTGVILGSLKTKGKSTHTGHLLSFIKASKSITKHYRSINNTSKKYVEAVGALMFVKVEASLRFLWNPG